MRPAKKGGAANAGLVVLTAGRAAPVLPTTTRFFSRTLTHTIAGPGTVCLSWRRLSPPPIRSQTSYDRGHVGCDLARFSAPCHTRCVVCCHCAPQCAIAVLHSAVIVCIVQSWFFSSWSRAGLLRVITCTWCHLESQTVARCSRCRLVWLLAKGLRGGVVARLAARGGRSRGGGQGRWRPVVGVGRCLLLLLLLLLAHLLLLLQLAQLLLHEPDPVLCLELGEQDQLGTDAGHGGTPVDACTELE